LVHLAETFFQRSADSTKRRCLLCAKAYKQNLVMSNTNTVTHLRFKHEDTLAAVRQRRAVQ